MSYASYEDEQRDQELYLAYKEVRKTPEQRARELTEELERDYVVPLLKQYNISDETKWRNLDIVDGIPATPYPLECHAIVLPLSALDETKHPSTTSFLEKMEPRWTHANLYPSPMDDSLYLKVYRKCPDTAILPIKECNDAFQAVLTQLEKVAGIPVDLKRTRTLKDTRCRKCSSWLPLTEIATEMSALVLPPSPDREKTWSFAHVAFLVILHGGEVFKGLPISNVPICNIQISVFLYK